MLEGLEKIIEHGKYQVPINTPTEPWIDVENIKILKDFNHVAEKFFSGMDLINKYILHPYNIWIGIYTISYPIAIVIGSAGILLWVMGWKKGIKLTGWTATGFAIIRVIGI